MKKLFILLWLLLFCITGYAADATLAWDAPTGTVDGYKVYYGTTSNNYTFSSSLTTNTTVNITGLNYNTKYYFVVRSITSGVESTNSNEVKNILVTTSNVTSITTTTATITWTTDLAATTQIEYGTTSSYGSFTTLDTGLITTHSVSLTGLTAGTTYHYKICSKDTSGNGTLKNDNTFSTISIPIAPTNLKINP